MWILLDMLIAVYAYPSWQWYIVLQNGSSPRSTEFLPIIWRWVVEIAIVVMRTSDERISTQRNTRCTWTKSVIWILMQSLRSLLQEKYKFLPAKYRRYPFKFFMSVCTNTCRVHWYVYVLLWVSGASMCMCWITPNFFLWMKCFKFTTRFFCHVIYTYNSSERFTATFAWSSYHKYAK